MTPVPPDRPRLGILAGGGALPRLVFGVAAAEGRRPAILGFPGHTDPETLALDPDSALFALGAVGAVLGRLRALGCQEVVLAGAIRRPALAELKPDARGLALLARVAGRALGDDGLLRAVAGELERDGFRLLGVPEVLADALAPAGAFGQVPLPPSRASCVARGVEVARGLGALDVGQAVAVQDGVVLACEAIEGTDAMIARAGALRRPGPGPLLVKLCKPGQDRRLDLPTIGPDTVAACVAAGFAGIAVQAGATLVIDRPRVTAVADAAGLFVAGVAG